MTLINKDKIYKGFFDGSAKPNPGDLKVGGYIEDENGNSIYKYSTILGQGTNNEAEYKSLIKLLVDANMIGIRKLEVFGDSALVVNQINGLFKVKNPRMKSLYNQVILYIKHFEYFKITHVMREDNSLADNLTQ